MTRLYSTSDVCRALGISRATLYTWDDAEPDWRGPGERSTLGWKAATIRRLAKRHGYTVDEQVLA